MRLGFAWVTDRMNGYGLLYGEPYLANYHGYLHAWRRILGKDEIAKVERESQAGFRWASFDVEIDSESDDEDFTLTPSYLHPTP